MPLQETFADVNGALVPGGLVNGKATVGITVFFDSITGRYYDVTSVASGKFNMPLWPRRRGGSAAEQCALYGAPVRELRKER